TGRAFWGRAGRLAFPHRLLDLLEVLDDPLAAAGQVPPSGLESLADVLEQVARVAADLALQILERGFSGLDRGPQTVERCAAGLLRTASLRHVSSLQSLLRTGQRKRTQIHQHRYAPPAGGNACRRGRAPASGWLVSASRRQ